MGLQEVSGADWVLSRQNSAFSPAEVAAYCNTSPETVRGWVKDGLITGINAHKNLYIPRRDLINTLCVQCGVRPRATIRNNGTVRRGALCEECRGAEHREANKPAPQAPRYTKSVTARAARRIMAALEDRPRTRSEICVLNSGVRYDIMTKWLQDKEDAGEIISRVVKSRKHGPNPTVYSLVPKQAKIPTCSKCGIRRVMVTRHGPKSLCGKCFSAMGRAAAAKKRAEQPYIVTQYQNARVKWVDSPWWKRVLRRLLGL